MLELVGIVVTEAGVDRLNRCSLLVRPGEVLGLVGPTGSGKSTALSVMAGAVAPDKGRISWEGRDLTRSAGKLRGLTGHIPHDLAGPPDLSVTEWLALWADLDAVSTATFREKAPGLLEQFGLARISRRPVASLSRGEARRLAWVRVWLRAPRLFLLDGPGDGVDGGGLRLFARAVKEASAAGASVVLTAVAPHVPTTLCDRVVVLVGGAVTQELSRGDAGFAAGVATAQGWAS